MGNIKAVTVMQQGPYWGFPSCTGRPRVSIHSAPTGPPGPCTVQWSGAPARSHKARFESWLCQPPWASDLTLLASASLSRK